MTSQELRKKYLDFFASKGHNIIPSASLIPENDPTVLFTTAGMHPLVPYLMGETHPEGRRLANAQKCIRTSDIDEVGDTTHHTFFEMLGNWSLGDPDAPDGIGASYFKKEAIEWSWEFLTSPDWLGLDKNRLAVSVFVGDDDPSDKHGAGAPFDQEAYDVWKNKIGMPEAKIAKLPKSENWWGPAGETGPCGPDTEIFYWTGDSNNVPDKFDPDDERWFEIWNDVFMEYNKTADGKYEKLKQKNVDTGMGIERTLAALNGLDDNYKTELFINLIHKIEQLSGKKYGELKEVTRAMRIIADHLKAATFIIGDDKGIIPSNTDQGYIVRRLIRRAIRYGRQLGIQTDEPWTKEIAKIVVHDYGAVYPELRKNVDFVIEQLKEEEIKFKKTLEKGLKIFDKEMGFFNFKESKNIKEEDIPDLSPINGFPGFTPHEITGKWLFDFYQTFGFPLELSLEEIQKRRGKFIDFELERIKREYNNELKKHQELSRTASAGKFKGGLADASKETKKLHTAAHLLLSSLRKVLGDHVAQKGSNITAERLRFDFSHSEKMTDEQKQEVEKLVNQAIKDDLPVSWEEMSLEEAKKQNAVGVFESKYGEKVKVYTVGKSKNVFSKEICGGPHVENTGQLGNFKIKKEQSSSAGVRRIKAVLA